MFSPDDTIVAIATPPGRGGLGVIRVSGPEAAAIAGRLIERKAPLEPRRATFTRVCQQQLGALDEVVVTWFPAPHSYTGQHVIEISAHGSPVVLHAIVRSAMGAGARLAQPGEFTLRAFLNGKRDLIQAEAVGDLIAAVTPLQARVAFDQLEGTLTRRIAEVDADLFDLIARLEASLDFPDEGYHFVEPADVAARVDALIGRVEQLLRDAARGRMIREGATVAIAGRPNVGKSSLFNALAGGDRAIVTAIPGTTRDLITEQIDLEGMPVTLVDTAGARETQDPVEREGVSRAVRAREVADLVLVVLDQSEPLTRDDEELMERTAALRRVLVANKADVTHASAMSSVVPGFGRTSRSPAHSMDPQADAGPDAGEGAHMDFRVDARADPRIDTRVEAGVDTRPGARVETGAVSGFSRTSRRSDQRHSFTSMVQVSALTGEGLPELRRAILRELTGHDALRDTAAVSNARHVRLLDDARMHLLRARDGARDEELPEEFILSDLQEARGRFDEIVGKRTTDDLLRHIFERFCIGK